MLKIKTIALATSALQFTNGRQTTDSIQRERQRLRLRVRVSQIIIIMIRGGDPIMLTMCYVINIYCCFQSFITIFFSEGFFFVFFFVFFFILLLSSLACCPHLVTICLISASYHCLLISLSLSLSLTVCLLAFYPSSNSFVKRSFSCFLFFFLSVSSEFFFVSFFSLLIIVCVCVFLFFFLFIYCHPKRN